MLLILADCMPAYEYKLRVTSLRECVRGGATVCVFASAPMCQHCECLCNCGEHVIRVFVNDECANVYDGGSFSFFFMTNSRDMVKDLVSPKSHRNHYRMRKVSFYHFR